MKDRSEVREILQNLLRQKGDVGGFADSDLLITGGRLSSYDAVEVVFLLEERYGISFGDRRLNLDALDSVDDIMRLLDDIAP